MATHEPACVGFKVCTKCGERKHIMAFAACKTGTDGTHAHCRSCQGKYSHSLYAKTAKRSALRDIAYRGPVNMEKG